MPQHRIIYTADVHGNKAQYQKLSEYAKATFADIIIIGGDITPISPQGNISIDFQRRFLEHELPGWAMRLRKALPNSKLLLMMGNDDCAANLDVLVKWEPELYCLIHNKRIKLTEDFDLIGYSYVPITPFGLKDWEKFDFSQAPNELEEEYEKRKRTNYELSGFKSSPTGQVPFFFTPEIEHQDSIQNDLEKEEYVQDAAKTVYVVHTPPSNTKLDQILRTFYQSGFAVKTSVGSLALRLFIEKHQPYLTLHGHIHETVNVSGNFKDRIGRTLCLAPGNYSLGNNLAVLVMDLYSPQNAKRIII